METQENRLTEPNITTQIETVKQQDNKEEKKLTGFALNPENINRNGRPKKGTAITDVIRDMLNEKPEIKKALSTKLLQMALDGDLAAIKHLMAYIDGMPTQKTEITGAEGEPLYSDNQLLKDIITKLSNGTRNS
jgi:hypothetical protein